VNVTPRRAAAALVATAGLYMIASLATGRSARAEAPLDLTPKPADLALDVWKAASALVEAEGHAAIVDVRAADAFASYHLPRAENVPGASGAAVAAIAKGRPLVLVYAGKDDVARKLVEDARRAAPGARIHFLADGARAWYLALGLPVALFSEQPPPDGYAEAVQRVQRFLARAEPGAKPAALESIQLLARTNYQPSLLKTGGPPKATGAKKKIAGGCG
jgi:rhodanese-related sulfurtransferase